MGQRLQRFVDNGTTITLVLSRMIVTGDWRPMRVFLEAWDAYGKPPIIVHADGTLELDC